MEFNIINKIYIGCYKYTTHLFTKFFNCPFYESFATTDEGHVLTSDISITENMAKADMGITTNKKHDIYNQKYPNGWEIIWITEPDKSSKWKSIIGAKIFRGSEESVKDAFMKNIQRIEV